VNGEQQTLERPKTELFSQEQRMEQTKIDFGAE
jgi:hypothetical protein